MLSFLLSLIALIVGYLLYGKFVERVFAPATAAPLDFASAEKQRTDSG